MKKFNLGYIVTGLFALVGFGLYAAVLIEWLVNDYEAAAWVTDAKVAGLVFLILACVTLAIVALVEYKKANKTEKVNNDKELLEKYKSVKNKK